MIAGIYQPSKGKIQLNGKLVPFIELGVGFNPELTGRENVYLNGALLGFSEAEVTAQYDSIVDFAELHDFMDQKLKNYSSGMQVRLAFSMAVRAKADILLLDEVLAVGDADFQRKCYDYFSQLKKEKVTVIFISHDMNAVREFCDRAMLVDNNRVIQEGKPSDIAEAYSKLFIDSERTEAGDSASASRWGKGGLATGKVRAKITDGMLVVDAEANAQQNFEKVFYGIHIHSRDGVEVTAMNNRMLLIPDIIDVKAGEVISFHWEMQNIFSDGTYYVTLTLADRNGEIIDWHSEATTFKVKRTQHSTTAVLPPVTVTTKRMKNE